MILYGVSIIIFLFVSGSLFFKCDCPYGVKIAGTLLILLVSLKFVIYQALGGAFFSPSLPRAFILCMEALYGALIVLFFLLVLLDLYLLGNWVLTRFGVPVPMHLPKGIIKCGLCLIALALGCYGTYEAVKIPGVRTIELRLTNLPRELENTNIVQLSDLHIGPLLKKDWLSETVNRVNALTPDLICLTGDYVDGHVSDLESELEPLAGLKSKYGIFGVTGNHEYYWNVTEWEEALGRLGIGMLNNEHKNIAINGQTLIVAGLPDLAAVRFGFPGPDLQKALKDAPEGLKLLLAHQPKMAREYLEQADIQLSGHTHGGLMSFLQPLIAHFNAGFVKGQYDISGKILYVNPGTGLWNGFSCRIGNPAEITQIILKKD